jgi:hypothetical protein
VSEASCFASGIFEDEEESSISDFRVNWVELILPEPQKLAIDAERPREKSPGCGPIV